MKIVLVLAAGILLFSANALAWLQCTILDSEEFRDRTATALDEPASREHVASALAERISESERIDRAMDERLGDDLAFLAPVLTSQLKNGLEAAAERVLESDGYRNLRDEMVLRLHTAVLNVLRDEAAVGVQEDRIVLDLSDLLPAVLSEIGLEVRQGLGGGEVIEEDGTIVLIEDAGAVRGLSFIARNADVVALVLANLGLACLAGLLVLSDDARRGLRTSGYAVLGVGVVTLLVVFVVNQAVESLYPGRAVLQELTSSMLSNLRLQALALALIGIVTAVLMDGRLIAAGQRAWGGVGAYIERTGLPAPLIVAGILVIILLVV